MVNLKQVSTHAIGGDATWEKGSTRFGGDLHLGYPCQSETESQSPKDWTELGKCDGLRGEGAEVSHVERPVWPGSENSWFPRRQQRQADPENKQRRLVGQKQWPIAPEFTSIVRSFKSWPHSTCWTHNIYTAFIFFWKWYFRQRWGRNSIWSRYSCRHFQNPESVAVLLRAKASSMTKWTQSMVVFVATFSHSHFVIFFSLSYFLLIVQKMV